MTAGNYFSWNMTASPGYNLSISGLGATSFSRGSTAPTSLALLYSLTNTWAVSGTDYRVISTGVNIPTTAADLSTQLAGDLGTTPITLAAGATGSFRVVYWGATTTSSGAIWTGTGTNDFSLTGTATSLTVIHNLVWAGGNGAWANATTGWLDGAAAANWTNNDNATINSAGTLTVGAGTQAGSVAVTHASGDVTLSGNPLSAASLTLSGAGNLVLNTSNVLSTASISNGKVVAGASDALGLGNLTLSASTLEVTQPAVTGLGNSAISIGAGDATIHIGTGAATTLGGTLSTTGTSGGAGVAKGDAQTFNTLTKTGTGKLSLSGNVGSQMTYSTGVGAGVTTVGGIALQITGGSLELLAAKTLNLASGILLDDAVAATVYNGMVWNGDVVMNGSTIQINGGNIRGTGTIKAGVEGSLPATNNTLAQRLNFNSPDISNSVVIATGHTLSLSAASGGSIVMIGGISGDGAVTKIGSGTARLDGANSYTGITTITAGTLRVGTGTNGTLGTGNVVITAGTLLLNRDDNVTIPNPISGAGNVTGSSLDHTISLSGANTYTGVTTVTSGKLGAPVLANGASVSSIGQSSNAASNLVFNGGSLSYEGATDASSDRDFTLGIDGGGLSATGTGGLKFTSTNAIAIDPLVPVPDSIRSVSATATAGGFVTGTTYKIATVGTTDFTLIGAANNAVDTIFVANGPGLGTGTAISGLTLGTIYRITTLGTTDFTTLGGANSSIGTVFTASANGFGEVGGGKVAYANGNHRDFRLGGSGSGQNSVAAVIADGAPDGVSFNQNLTSLTKNGTSTWSISGTNTYTGPTKINTGTLKIAGDNSAATGAVTVLGTAALGGNGSSGAAVTLESGGGLAAKISDWTGSAGTGYEDLAVVNLNAAAVPMTVTIDTSGLVNFTEVAKSFTILNTSGGITNFSPANVTVSAPGFTGTGTWTMAKVSNSLVLSYALAVVADPYLAWATGAPYNLSGGDELAGADPDKDGISNSIEFVSGGNPANGSNTALLPTLVVNPTNIVFTYRLSDVSAYLNPKVQYGSNLGGWTTAQNGVNGVTIGAPTVLETGIKQVVVTIPKALAAGSKLFARLNVVVP